VQDYVWSNYLYVKAQVSAPANAGDPFWTALGLALGQAEGVALGYATAVAASAAADRGPGTLDNVPLREFLTMNAMGAAEKGVGA